MVNCWHLYSIAPLSKALYNWYSSFTHSQTHSHTNGDSQDDSENITRVVIGIWKQASLSLFTSHKQPHQLCSWLHVNALLWYVCLNVKSKYLECKIPKQLTQCSNISEWRRCFILLVWLRRKGIILSVSLNGAMAEMSNQLKSRLESGVNVCDYTAPPPGENRPEAFSVNSLL